MKPIEQISSVFLQSGGCFVCDYACTEYRHPVRAQACTG